MKEIFRFSRSERIASLILLVLTLAVIVLLARMRRMRPLPDEESRIFDSLVVTLLPPEDPPEKERKRERDVLPGKEVRREKPPVRDPNGMTREQWEALGVSPRITRIILHYREKGGRFRKREDVKKIYGMSNSLYEAVAPFLAVADSGGRKRAADTFPSRPSSPPVGNKPRRAVLTDINAADSAAFDSLPGIPPFLARRIVRYRHLLGGFVRKEQLLEVYGLDSLTYAGISGRLQVDTAGLRRIDVNSADPATLARHPYLSRHEAEAVIFYREHIGRIKNVDILLQEHVLPEKTFRKVSPYLRTGPEK